MNKIASGLFGFRGRNWWLNILDIPVFLKRVCFTLRHGYAPQAQWETYSWFIAVMREVLDFYANRRMGDVPTPGLTKEENKEYYDALYKHMRSLLDIMDESYYEYTDTLTVEEQHKRYDEAVAAKDEFFKLFAKQFYNLWDQRYKLL